MTFLGAGGMVTALLELTFANSTGGLKVNLDGIDEKDFVKILFSENPGLLIQVHDADKVMSILGQNDIQASIIGKPITSRHLTIKHHGAELNLDINHYRDIWYKTSLPFGL